MSHIRFCALLSGRQHHRHGRHVLHQLPCWAGRNDAGGLFRPRVAGFFSLGSGNHCSRWPKFWFGWSTKVFMHQWSTKVVMDPAFESTNWLIQKLHWLFSVPVFDAISMTTRMIILKELVSKTTADWWWLVAMTGLWLSRNTWEWNVIIPTDDWLINIFQRGRLKPPTSHSHMFFFNKWDTPLGGLT